MTSPESQGVATAPASSANLGPGFDVIALALDIRCRVVAAPSDEWVLHEAGRISHPGPAEFVVRAARAAVERPLAITVENRVPRTRGLGSSSAVATAVAAASFRAVGVEPESSRLLEIVAGLEGHADNAAAAVYGGLVAVSGLNVRALELSSDIVPVVAIPDTPLSTREARLALGATIDRSEAARTLARLAFLIEGLRSGDPDVLREARGDEFHEAPRSALSPITGEMIETALEAGALHASWSGAGPTALALTTPDSVDKVVDALTAAIEGRGRVEVLRVAADGWA